jgi:hypothetical protein
VFEVVGAFCEFARKYAVTLKLPLPECRSAIRFSPPWAGGNFVLFRGHHVSVGTNSDLTVPKYDFRYTPIAVVARHSSHVRKVLNNDHSGIPASRKPCANCRPPAVHPLRTITISVLVALR